MTDITTFLPILDISAKVRATDSIIVVSGADTARALIARLLHEVPFGGQTKTIHVAQASDAKDDSGRMVDWLTKTLVAPNFAVAAIPTQTTQFGSWLEAHMDRGSTRMRQVKANSIATTSSNQSGVTQTDVTMLDSKLPEDDPVKLITAVRKARSEAMEAVVLVDPCCEYSDSACLSCKQRTDRFSVPRKFWANSRHYGTFLLQLVTKDDAKPIDDQDWAMESDWIIFDPHLRPLKDHVAQGILTDRDDWEEVVVHARKNNLWIASHRAKDTLYSIPMK